jgi:glycosyltransferase involved in cell wall biosynthesis
MKRILLYDNEIGGHHIQYIKYVLNYVNSNIVEDVFILACLPETIREHLNVEHFESNGKIKFLLKDFNSFNSANGTKEYLELQMIHDICEEQRITEVLFMVLDLYFKAIALNKRKRTYHYNGIYFNIFLRRYDKNLSLPARYTRHLRFNLSSFFWLMRSTKKINTAYVLSDRSCLTRLKRNILFKQVFEFIPEPVTRYDENKLLAYDLRSRYNVPADAKVVLVTGAIAPRKNIIRVIQALTGVSEKIAAKVVLVIAGHIQSGLPDTFEQELEEAIAGLSESRENISVVYRKDYLTDEALNAHIFMCDLVCIPYLDSFNSSAILYQAVNYKKTILGSNTGFMGEVIEKYRLGITVNPHSVREINSGIISAFQGYNDSHNKRDLFLREYTPLPEFFAAALLNKC